MCDAPLSAGGDGIVELTDERIDELRKKVNATREGADASKKVLEESTRDYEAMSQELSKYAAELADRRQQITALVNQLPPEELVARRQHDELRALEQRVESLRASIKEKREAFAAEMTGHRESIRRFATAIKHAFEKAAHGFLLEDGGLSWSPVRAQVGQAGTEGAEPVEYPAFAVDLSGGDFASVVRRDGPDQVSESQREFIDLAFRMSLIHVAADNQAGTIVIDAPESSLDAVFIDRVANVLARFANANGLNRLLATSNLASSELVPALLIAAENDAPRRRDRVVDLFVEGVPTKAMRELADEYTKYREQLYRKISKD